MPMTKVIETKFNEVIESINDYEIEEDTVNGAKLNSYFCFDKRFAQSIHTVDDLNFYLLDEQHCERILRVQK